MLQFVVDKLLSVSSIILRADTLIFMQCDKGWWCGTSDERNRQTTSYETFEGFVFIPTRSRRDIRVNSKAPTFLTWKKKFV